PLTVSVPVKGGSATSGADGPGPSVEVGALVHAAPTSTMSAGTSKPRTIRRCIRSSNRLERGPHREAEGEPWRLNEVVVEHPEPLRVVGRNQTEWNVQHGHEEPRLDAGRGPDRARVADNRGLGDKRLRGQEIH